MSKLIALLFEEEQEMSRVMAMPPDVDSGQPTMGGAAPVVDPDPNMALGVMKTIQAKAKEADVKLEDAVIVFKNPKGETKIKQLEELTPGKGAKRGIFWGLLAGLILGGPIGGILWGLGIGAIVGGVIDHGIDNKWLKTVSDWLTPGRSAILLMVKDEDAEGAIAYLETFDTEMHVADVSDLAKEAAEKAADHEDLAEAVQAEYDIE